MSAPSADNWVEQVMAMTDGLGVDVAIEAVGVPATFDACTKIVRPGGTVASVGVHGGPVELNLQDLWISDIAITMGLVSTSTTPMLLKLVAQLCWVLDPLSNANAAGRPSGRSAAFCRDWPPRGRRTATG